MLLAYPNISDIDFHMVSGKKKTSPKQPHLKPPPQDALHHLCYLCVSQYYFDINSAELPFTSFDDIE